MTQKSNLFTDIALPLFGVIATVFLLLITYQFWSENRNMLLAEKEGPLSITCKDLMNRRDLVTRAVEITNAGWDGKFSTAAHEGRTSINIVLQPDENDAQVGGVHDLEGQQPGSAGPYAIVVDFMNVTDFNDVKEVLDENSFKGILRTAAGLDFDHHDQLKVAYPEIDFEKCYVLKPGIAGSSEVNTTFIAMACFWFCLMVGSCIWFVTSVRSAMSQGITVAPAPLPTPTVQALRYQPFRDFSFQPFPIAESRIEATEIRTLFARFRRFLLLFAFAQCFIVVPIGMMGKANMLPADFMPYFWMLFYVFVASWAINVLLMGWRAKQQGNPVRIPIRPHSLPRCVTRAFRKQDEQLLQMGYICQGDYRTNDYWNQVTREYLSADKKFVVRLTWEGPIGITGVYTLIDNGQVIATVNKEISSEYHHPVISMTSKNVKSIRKLVSLHRQLMHRLADNAVTVEPHELDALATYTETLELQLVKRIPLALVDLPQFKSCLQRHGDPIGLSEYDMDSAASLTSGSRN